MGFMEQLDEEYAPGWKPEPGDTVQGIIVAISKRDTQWGPYPILTLQRISGEPETLTDERIAVHCQGTAMTGWCDTEMPAIGDRVGFRYNGKKSNKSGSQTYHDYARTIQRYADVPLDLRAVAPRSTPAATPATPAEPVPAAAAPAHGQPAQAQGAPW